MGDEQLVVIGYECKVFDDAEKALWIDSKSHLVPWNGEKSLMIDRFDVRGLLLDVRAFDADCVPADRRGCAPAEDQQLEKLCDQERYRDTTARDSAASRDDDQDREWLRFQEALQDDGLHAVAYEYEDKEYDPTEPTEDEYPDTVTLDEEHSGSTTQPVDEKSNGEKVENESSTDPPYVIPRGLIIPHDMNLPESGKLGVVIEKTADLVANQGAQMEVLLKTKQANNAMFDFLNFNSNLHPFYRFILSMIKSRRYTPQPQPQPPQPKPNPLTQPQSTVSGTANSNANNTAAVKRQPVASIVIDHSSGDDSEGDNSSDDSDEESSGYLHPLLGGARPTSQPTTKNDSAAGNNNTPPVRDQENGANNSSESTSQRSSEEKQKLASTLELCQQNAYKAICIEQLGQQVAVIPPPPDLQMLVDRVAKQVASNTEPTVFEENLRQRLLAVINGTTSKPLTDETDIFQNIIDSKSYFLWPGDMTHVYYRFKKYFFRECLKLFGCVDPEEEMRKKEEAIKELQSKKAAAVARAKKRPSGPVKFSLSEGAKKLKLKREGASSGGGGGNKVTQGNALPYEPSDDSDSEVDEFGGVAAAESILQDEEDKQATGSQIQPADDEKVPGNSSSNPQNTSDHTESNNNKDSDSALRAMTEFLSELEAKHGSSDLKSSSDTLAGGRLIGGSPVGALKANNLSSTDLADDTEMPMSQYEKALQAERKKKASMFLQRLKQSSGLQSNTSESSKDSVD